MKNSPNVRLYRTGNHNQLPRAERLRKSVYGRGLRARQAEAGKNTTISSSGVRKSFRLCVTQVST
jgi:hypothetical protein